MSHREGFVYVYTTLTGLTIGTTYTLTMTLKDPTSASDTVVVINVYDGTTPCTVWTGVPSSYTPHDVSGTFVATATSMLVVAIAWSINDSMGTNFYSDKIMFSPYQGVSKRGLTGMVFSPEMVRITTASGSLCSAPTNIQV